MKTDISEARAIIERLGQLSAHENIGACRADLIEAHRLLGDALAKIKEATALLTEQLQDAPSGRDWNQVFAARQILRVSI